MIISHKHKFIFFKTRKTAGSSIQVALAEYCGKDDIITGQYRLGIDDHSHSAGLNMDKFFTNHPHPELAVTRKFLGEKIWKSYFKFAFVRNPFDIAVSRYHWDLKGKKGIYTTSKEGFKEWVKNGNLLKEDSLSNYIADTGGIQLDYIGYYENLEYDLKRICEKINIPIFELARLKGGFRDKIHYSEFYDEEIIQIVNEFYRYDIDLFEYKFEYPAEAKIKDPRSIINRKVINDNNINGPSLIKVPSYIKNKLGKYYLYFANHRGTNIRMAYANNLEGPWSLYKPGTLQLNETKCKTHIASPDVHIEEGMIVMYFHGDTDSGQYTFKATSRNGINFISEDQELGLFYFRVFNHSGETYAIAKNKNIDGIIYKKEEGKFNPLFNLIDRIRHTAIHVDNDIIYIFYTIVGEMPESLYICKIKDWEIVSNYKLKEPEYEWEGAKQPLIPSKFGSALGFVNELRDPCIYREDNNLYLLYSYGGETGIAISKLEFNEK